MYCLRNSEKYWFFVVLCALGIISRLNKYFSKNERVIHRLIRLLKRFQDVLRALCIVYELRNHPLKNQAIFFLITTTFEKNDDSPLIGAHQLS